MAQLVAAASRNNTSQHSQPLKVRDFVANVALFLVCIGIVLFLFQSIVRVEHPNWLILGERTSWTKEVEEHVARRRRVMPNGVGERGRRVACVQGTRRRSGAACTSKRVSISRVHTQRAW